MNKPINQNTNRKKLYAILVAMIVMIPIIIVSYIGFIYNLSPKINTFAKEIKNLPTDNSQVYISTSATDNHRGYDNNYVVNSNSGKYFIIKQRMIFSSNEDSSTVIVLGKYNGYTYVYVDTEGIAKIKNGKSSLVLSRTHIDNISMKSNRLVYEDCDYFAMCKETHLVNLDNESDKTIIKSNDYKHLYSSGIVLYKSGYITNILDSNIAIYNKDGGSVVTLPRRSMQITSVDGNNIYFAPSLFSKDESMVVRYNYNNKTESQLTLSEYYSNVYNIKIDVMTDGQRLVDVINSKSNTNIDLNNLELVNSDNLFFKSKDELKIFKVNKKTGVKTKIFDCSRNNEKIMDVIWI